MKRLIFAFLFFITSCPSWAAFTEFYVQTTASNLNAGSSNTDAAAFTYTSAVLAAGWNSATGVFTVASGTPNSDMPAMADGTHFASVYVTAGATVATFVGRVTAVSSTTITVSLTAVAGSPPATDALGATTLKVDGAWDGPAGAVGFPFGFPTAVLVNSTGDYPRINIKGGVQYDITAAMTHAANGPLFWEGYTTSVGDLGRATIDGGATGTSYVLLTTSGTNNNFKGIIFNHNGNSGSAGGLVSNSAAENFFSSCVFANGYRSGLNNGQTANITECEFYGNNVSNSSTHAGLTNASTIVADYCIFHDQAGTTNGVGVYSSGMTVMQNCIFDTNPASGVLFTGTGLMIVEQCDFYANGADGILTTTASAITVFVKNSNFILNTGYGINSSGSVARNGVFRNNGFGAGTQANTLGTINAMGPVQNLGAVTYASNVTPWNAPTTGDFRITLTAAKAAGRGAFTETAASYTGTVGYPAIGAAQADASATGGGQKGFSY